MKNQLKTAIGLLLLATIGFSSCTVQYRERRRARHVHPPHREEVIIVH